MHPDATTQSAPTEYGAPVKCEEALIPVRLDQIEKSIAEAHGLIDQLENRLMTVSSGEVPELDIVDQIRKEASPVAERLANHRDGIQTLTARLRNLDTRLEL